MWTKKKEKKIGKIKNKTRKNGVKWKKSKKLFLKKSSEKEKKEIIFKKKLSKK